VTEAVAWKFAVEVAKLWPERRKILGRCVPHPDLAQILDREVPLLGRPGSDQRCGRKVSPETIEGALGPIR